MAFYFSSDTNALYDTDVFPVASLPANKVEITEAVYFELLTKQNQGYVILADGSGNPYTVNQSEASATDIKHAASVATTLALGHVKIGNTMEAANDGTLDLKDGAVTTEKIVDANVTADKLASNSVTTAKIADANVTADKLASDSVTTAKIADGTVTADKLATDSVTTAKIADGTVTEEKLESVKDLSADETTLTMTEDANGFTVGVKDGGIGTQQLTGDSVTTAKIADANVTADKLASNSVTTAKIVDANVTADKLATDSVTTAKIADANVTADKLASDSVTTAKIVDANVTADKLATDSVTTAKIEDGAVTGKKLNSSTVDYEAQIEIRSSDETQFYYLNIQDTSLCFLVFGFKNIGTYPFQSARIKIYLDDTLIGNIYFYDTDENWHYEYDFLKVQQGTLKFKFEGTPGASVVRPSVSISVLII